MSDPLNLDYFASLTSAVNATNSCAELQAVTTQVLTSLATFHAALITQQTALDSLAALLTPPTTPSEVVSWIGTLITDYLGPQVAAYTATGVKIAALEAAVVSLTAAIVSKSHSFPSCTIIT